MLSDSHNKPDYKLVTLFETSGCLSVGDRWRSEVKGRLSGVYGFMQTGDSWKNTGAKSNQGEEEGKEEEEGEREETCKRVSVRGVKREKGNNTKHQWAAEKIRRNRGDEEITGGLKVSKQQRGSPASFHLFVSLKDIMIKWWQRTSQRNIHVKIYNLTCRF